MRSIRILFVAVTLITGMVNCAAIHESYARLLVERKIGKEDQVTSFEESISRLIK
jgi:hypothetical protein